MGQKQQSTQLDLEVKDPKIKGSEDADGPGYSRRKDPTKRPSMGQGVPLEGPKQSLGLSSKQFSIVFTP